MSAERTALRSRLYRGETRIGFIKNRKKWYIASAIVALLCVLSLSTRGFNYGVAFSGGTTFQIKTSDTSITPADVDRAFTDNGHAPDSPTVEVGDSSNRQLVTNTKTLDPRMESNLKTALAKDLGVGEGAFSIQSISSQWGHETTLKRCRG